MQHRIEDAVVAGLNVLLSNARHSSFMFILDYIDMARLLGMESLWRKSSFLNFLTFCFRDFLSANFVSIKVPSLM